MQWDSDVSRWTLVSGMLGTVTSETGDHVEGDSSFQFAVPSGTSGSQYTYGDFIAVDPRRTYAGAITAKMINGTGTFGAGVLTYDAAKELLEFRRFIVVGVTLGTEWTEFTGRIGGEGTGSGTFPAGTRFIKPAIFVHEGNVGTTRVDAFSIVMATSRSTTDNDVAAKLLPAGTVIAFASETCPAGFRRCDGAQLPAADHPELFNAIGTNFGGGGPNFHLPDLRGQFVRGWDSNAGRDPDRDGRTASAAGGQTGNRVGSTQGHVFGSHSHDAYAPFNDVNSSASQGFPNGNVHHAFRTTDRGREYPLQAGAISSAGGNETRPTNVYLNFCIKL